MSKGGVLPQTDLMWRYVWEYAENDMNKCTIKQETKYMGEKKGHKSRKD
jgi:hypothetical protein